ncbi:astacin-like metalloendopeptidase [Engystomops pustulosus]|uniref:astacin-like metalloendopeptidase n=1 Tax=Engystomops pustulosus TaxID=76066 RepID=UPI003AFB8203
MHSLGFFHEHTREDRDNYIEVNWENIAPANKAIFNFDDGNHQDLPYDYNSIMHYDRYSFSKVPGQPVMVPKPNRTLSMGESPGMDNLDVMKINRLYKCDLCRMKFVNKSDTFTYNSTSSGSSCFYLIQTFIKVLLQLSNLSVPVSPGCNDAYIKVYDGTSTSSPLLLNKTCGSDIVPPLVSSGRFMLIEIVNNQPSSPSSFSGSYDTVKYGATYLSNTGLVSSPAFPLFPPRNADMVFSIIAPKDKRKCFGIVQYPT